jgi:hypothetical protein
MPATASNKSAAVTELLKIVRELDIQGFTNQDNKTLTNRRYDISSLTLSVSPNYITTITMASAAIAANFQVNEVIKFFTVLDATLSGELSDTEISNEQRKIREISGADIILYLDSSGFTGTYASGKISSTYNIQKLTDLSELIIADFEIDTGVPYLPASHIHNSCIRDLAYLNWGKVSGAEKLLIQSRYDRRIELLSRGKGEFYSSQDVDTDSDDDDSDFSNDNFKLDMGFGISTTPLTD